MMRQSQGALRMLFRMQADRQKQENNQEAGDRVASTRHCAIGPMAEAPSSRPAPAPVAGPPASPPQPKPEPKPLKTPRPDPLPATRQSAAIYPRRPR